LKEAQLHGDRPFHFSVKSKTGGLECNNFLISFGIPWNSKAVLDVHAQTHSPTPKDGVIRGGDKYCFSFNLAEF
jgi:hypothetical protein